MAIETSQSMITLYNFIILQLHEWCFYMSLSFYQLHQPGGFKFYIKLNLSVYK